MKQAADEEDLWARAQAALESSPPEPAPLRAARERYDRRLTRISVALATAAGALALVGILVDPGGDRSTWRVVAAATVVVLALLLMTVGPLTRPLGSTRDSTRPLEWLSRWQRRELEKQVRAGSAVPGRLRLARLQARAMIDRRVDRLPLAGFVIGYVGLWIWDHSWSRTLPTLLVVAVMVVVALRIHRDVRLARRSLAEHPDPEDTRA